MQDPQRDAFDGETGSCLNEVAERISCVRDVVGGHGPWQFRFWATFFLASLCCSLHLFSTLPLTHLSSNSCTCADHPPENKSGSVVPSLCDISNCSTRTIEVRWNELSEPCFSLRHASEDDASECTNAGSVFYAKCSFIVGSLVSMFITYPLMNRYGRRPVSVISCFLLCACSSAGTWAVAPGPFLVLKLVLSLGLVSVYLVAASSLSECVGEEFRLLYFFTAHVSWGVAHFLLPFLTWTLPDWTSFNVALTVPCYLLLISLCFLPESAESYASRGLMSRAHKVMRNAARWNGFSLQGLHHFSPNLLLKEREENNDLVSDRKVKKTRILLLCIGLFLAGFLSTFTYFTMMWLAEWLPLKRGSFFSLLGTSEVAASLLLLSLSHFVPIRRAWSLTSCLSSIFLIVMYVKGHKAKPKFSRGFHMVQMFFASASWTLILMHALTRPLNSNRAKCLSVGMGICMGLLAATLADIQKLSSWDPILLLMLGAPNAMLAVFIGFIPERYLEGLNL